MDKEKLIQKYISKNISEDEKLKVESLLKSDPDFKSEFEAHKDLVSAFQISESENLKKYFQGVENKLGESTGFKFLKYKPIYLAIACAMLIGFYYTMFNVESGNSLFKSNFNPLPNTYQPVVRANNSNENTVAFSAYENGDYRTAEKEFEQLLLINEDPNIKFYYALTLLNQSKFDLALIQFNKLKDVNHDYKSEELWYTALILIKKDDFKAAKQKLKKLETSKSKFKSEELKLLLQELKNI